MWYIRVMNINATSVEMTNEYRITIIYQTGEEFEEEIYDDSSAQAVIRAIEDSEQSPSLVDLNIKTIKVNRIK